MISICEMNMKITPTPVMIYHWWIPCERWFLPAAARARGQYNDLNREILASNLFNCRKEVINAPPVPSISRCIHIVYRHKNVWEYQWLNFIYNCMSTFLHYVRCKDALLDCSAPGGERCESLTRVDEITLIRLLLHLLEANELTQCMQYIYRQVWLDQEAAKQARTMAQHKRQQKQVVNQLR